MSTTPDPRVTRRSWRIRHAPLILTVVVLLASPAVLSGFGARSSEAATGWNVSVAPTTNLLDGQRLTVNIKSDADVNVVNVEIRECRPDASYAVADDFSTRTGKCPAGPVSSSADTAISRNAVQGIIDRIHDPAGMNLLFRVGVGTVTWKETTGEFAMTCDPSNPCALVVQLQFGDGSIAYQKVPLTFAVDDPVAACGGPASGVLSSAASDQLIDAWASWTRDFCGKGLATGAPTRSTFSGEGLAVRDFANGNLDLAYTSAGYNAAIGIGPTDASKQRNAVTTPLALNAAVIAVGGGYSPPPGDKVPYPEIKLTAGEAAAIFAGGLPWFGSFTQPYRNSILSENPVLNGELNYVGGLDSRPAVASSIESVAWYVSNFFLQRSPGDWILPGNPPTPRGAVNSFAVADPPFPELNTFSGRPSLKKVTDPLFAAPDSGPMWVLTDLATARALGLTPVSIQTASGEYVAPTEASMLAAVQTMKPDEHGMLQPDPNAGGAVSAAAAGATPYPLTYVEYAMTPKEPLVDQTTCTLRSSSQALLTKWLTYVVGDGQKNLPAGLLPLPSELATQAQQSIATIGTADVTGPCAGRVVTPGGAPAPTGGGGVGAGAAAGALPTATGPKAGALANTGLAAGPLGTTPAAASAGDQKAKEVLAAVPAFAGHSLPDSTGGVVALLGIVLVTSLAAWLTAGGGVGSTGVALAGGGASSGFGPSRTARPRTSGLVLLWVGVAATGVGLVVYQLGPLLQQRDQHHLINEYRRELRQAAKSSSGLPGVTTTDKAPEIGTPVGVLEIGGLRQQAVVVEGVSPSQTQEGPGHVPGTAGLGQPGNAAIVARRNGYGGSFANLDSLATGARILVTTTQGQSVYRVRSVKHVELVSEAPSDNATTSYQKPGAKRSNGKTVDALYGPTTDDRLTLVTSGSRAFWNTSSAVVVTARMVGKPFPPTAQGGRSDEQTGRNGDSSAWASVVLVLMLYAAAIVGAVFLYRRMQFRVAYILTVAPLVALTVIAGETLSRLLPAWL